MSTLYDRLLEIASDRYPGTKPNKAIQLLAGISSGRVTQIKKDGAVAKLSEEKMANVVAKGYLRDWIADGKGPQKMAGHQVAEPIAMPYIHQNPIVRQVVALMDQTDDAGKGMILMAAHQALEKYRPVKETA